MKKSETTKIRCMGCMEEYEERKPDGLPEAACPCCGYERDTPAKEAYHLTPGSILQGKYIVGRTLGYGGFGVTYVGFDAQLERKVAIKEYLPGTFATRMPGQTELTVYSGEMREQFQSGLDSFVEEAKRLMKFNELPGTVDIYDSFAENGTGYIVMEYLAGRTVKEMLAGDGVFQYEEAKGVALQVLATLKEVHRAGIIHRDIAPDNIFVLPDGNVRLIDFGASRYATTIHSKSLSVILKPGYAPEEQYRSRGNQGPWSDVYALAATMYKMVTGITPEESMERMMKDEVKEPSKLGVKLSENDENAIMNAMNVQISDRTQNADEFEAQLTSGDEVTRAASTLKKYDGGKVPRWAKSLASCLAAVVIVVGVLIATGVIDLTDGAVVSALTGRSVLAENEVRVPEVLNRYYEEAEASAAGAELLLVITDKQSSDKVDADLVLSQNPLPGRILERESALSVVVSAGAETEIQEGIMPDVTFRTLADAIAMLEAAGIQYRIVEEESDTVQKDGVIRQETIAGSQVGEGVVVVIVVSTGSEKQQTATQKAAETVREDASTDTDQSNLPEASGNQSQTESDSSDSNSAENNSGNSNSNSNGSGTGSESSNTSNSESGGGIGGIFTKKYDVVFKDYDGAILGTQVVEKKQCGGGSRRARASRLRVHRLERQLLERAIRLDDRRAVPGEGLRRRRLGVGDVNSRRPHDRERGVCGTEDAVPIQGQNDDEQYQRGDACRVCIGGPGADRLDGLRRVVRMGRNAIWRQRQPAD
jgi:serine/threonine protein kinase